MKILPLVYMPAHRTSLSSVLQLSLSTLLLAGLLSACQSSTPTASILFDSGDGTAAGTGTTAETISALQNGGYIIFLRHVQTEAGNMDETGLEVGNCATQRVLSEKGWQDARAMGRAFTELSIPVGEVLTSEFCRAWQNADLTFGKYETTSALNGINFEAETPEEMKERALPLLLKIPAPGTNTVLVSHSHILMHATGINPEPQGVALVFKTDGKTVKVVGKIEPQQWAEFSGQ